MIVCPSLLETALVRHSPAGLPQTQSLTHATAQQTSTNQYAHFHALMVLHTTHPHTNQCAHVLHGRPCSRPHQRACCSFRRPELLWAVGAGRGSGGAEEARRDQAGFPRWQGGAPGREKEHPTRLLPPPGYCRPIVVVCHRCLFATTHRSCFIGYASSACFTGHASLAMRHVAVGLRHFLRPCLSQCGPRFCLCPCLCPCEFDFWVCIGSCHGPQAMWLVCDMVLAVMSWAPSHVAGL